MLTGLDFPAEFLYGERAVWVRDDGGGSARMGLCLPVVAPTAEVVHVRLARPGSLVSRGSTVGHVEFEDGTFDLVAPVSGEVLIANGDVRDDPSLVRRAPFGVGYLFDLENVSKDELQELMDREEALAFYSRVEPPGRLRATARYGPGRAWPISLEARFGDVVFARARVVPPEANEIFVPDWEAGQRWVVETRSEGATRRFEYVVEGDGRLAGEEVTRVRVTEASGEGTPTPSIERVLHFRRDDFTLAAWDAVPLRDRSAVRRTFNERGRELWLRAGREDGFLLDHPKLPVGVEDETRDVPSRGGDLGDLGGDDPCAALLPAVSSHVRFRSRLTRCEVELRADLPRPGGGTVRLLSTQVWEIGRRFFVEASRSLGGREVIRAKLVSD